MAEDKEKKMTEEQAAEAAAEEKEAKAETEAEKAEKAEAGAEKVEKGQEAAEECGCDEAADDKASDSKADNSESDKAGEPKAAEPEKGDAKSSEEAESERYMRLMAEFQNFKKRAAKEKTDIHAYANEKLMNELLPVLDNFERALETKTDDSQSEELKNYAQGMELIFQQMKTALSNHGLKEILALGEDFDPNKHSAVMTEETDEYESGKVSKVLQKGYELNGRVIRPAMVAVSK